MKWKGRATSSNVEDRRGKRISGKNAGKFSFVGIIAVIIYVLVTGKDPSKLMQNIDNNQQTIEQNTNIGNAENEELAEFTKVVLKDTEDVWAKLFREQLGKEYIPVKMVIFNGQTSGTCGIAGTTTGPYYCPADQTIYMDLNFLRDMKKRFDAGGDFAQAYVIAHEVGHHIQYLLGILQDVYAQKQKLSQADFNKLSVNLELQADFLAGMWAHHAQKMKNILEEGDIQEAMNAAGAVGDDRLQMRSKGYVVPDSFTHGTSKQRTSWFLKGFKTGSFKYADTFN